MLIFVIKNMRDFVNVSSMAIIISWMRYDINHETINL